MLVRYLILIAVAILLAGQAFAIIEVNSFSASPVVGSAIITNQASITAPEQRTGLIVPLFSEYSQQQLNEVKEIIQAKETHPVVPMYAIINPSTGPGSAANQSIVSEVKELRAANVSVLGYVPTNWGTDSVSSVESNILQYSEWYHVNGVQLDQMPNWEYDGPQGQWWYSGPGGVYMPSYFSNLTAYAKSLGMTMVYANSGADVPQNFIGTVDVIGIFENSFLAPFFSSTPSVASLTGADAWHLNYSKSNFCFTSYNVSSISPYYIAAASNYVGYMFVTNGTEPQPYSVLPPYFDQLVADLASIVPVSVNTELVNGTEISMQTVVTQANGLSTSGFAPDTFDVVANTTVTIAAPPYSGLIFSHWSNGMTNSTIEISPARATALTAYYIRNPLEGYRVAIQ